MGFDGSSQLKTLVDGKLVQKTDMNDNIDFKAIINREVSNIIHVVFGSSSSETINNIVNNADETQREDNQISTFLYM